MRIKYKINDTAFAGGLFSRRLDRYYRPEFITHLGLRNTEYNVFRLVYFCTDQNMDGGYMTYTSAEIAKELEVSKSCVNKALSRLTKSGLIIRELVQRNGKLCPGYRVDKQDIRRRIAEAENSPKTENLSEAENESKEKGDERIAKGEKVSESPSPEGRGTSIRQDKPDTSRERLTPGGSSCEAGEGDRGTGASDITSPEGMKLSHSPSVRTSLTPPSKREASKGGDDICHE